MPKMTHEDSDIEIDVETPQIPLYESQGWSVKWPKSRKTSPSSDPS